MTAFKMTWAIWRGRPWIRCHLWPKLPLMTSNLGPSPLKLPTSSWMHASNPFSLTCLKTQKH